MCGRFEAFTQKQIERVVRDIESGCLRPVAQEAAEGAEPVLQMRPGMPVAVVGPRKLAVEQRKWGIKHPRGLGNMINARVESAGLAMWRQPFAEGRAIVPARAYFEPHETETVLAGGKERKKQYLFRAADETPLLMAGVAAGEGLVVVTTEALPNIAGIHPRMPLLLRTQDAIKWLVGAWEEIPRLPQFELVAEPEPIAQEQLALF